MTLIICISDFWKNKTFYVIKPPVARATNGESGTYSLEVFQQSASKKLLPVLRNLRKCFRCEVDGISFFYLNMELLNFMEYRKLLTTHLNLKGIQMLRLQVVQPAKEIIDWKWNRMLAYILWERIETEYLMSWLSTLGGAFSALGEQFSKCAEMAGKISRKQLMIGIKLDDPFLQSRCKLFYSISLIQTGRLRSAKYIIREQYRFARMNEEIDGRLVKMCKGIWLKLQYEYGRKLKARKK